MTIVTPDPLKVGATLITEFFIPGKPVQQGSKTAFVVGKRAIVTDQNDKTLKPWRAHVAATATAAHPGPRIEGPVIVIANFHLERPQSVKREYPTVYPDLDKFVRALLDGITQAETVWRDDAQVVSLHASKSYSETAGVLVRVGEYQSQPPLEGAIR